MNPDVFITIVYCSFVAFVGAVPLVITSRQRQTDAESRALAGARRGGQFSKAGDDVAATKTGAGFSIDPLGVRFNPQTPAAASDGQPRLLVIADEHCGSPALWQEIYARVAGAVAVHVVVPVRVSHLHYLTNDERDEAQASEDRVRLVVGLLRQRGISVTGGVGSDDPLESMTDALAAFPATRVLLATSTKEDSYWMERGLLTKALALTPLEVSQVVVPSAPVSEDGSTPDRR